MKNQRGFTVVEVLLMWLIVALGAFGWIANIVKIASSDFVNISGMLVLRVVGIFVAPLGAILGFL